MPRLPRHPRVRTLLEEREREGRAASAAAACARLAARRAIAAGTQKQRRCKAPLDRAPRIGCGGVEFSVDSDVELNIPFPSHLVAPSSCCSVSLVSRYWPLGSGSPAAVVIAPRLRGWTDAGWLSTQTACCWHITTVRRNPPPRFGGSDTAAHGRKPEPAAGALLRPRWASTPLGPLQGVAMENKGRVANVMRAPWRCWASSERVWCGEARVACVGRSSAHLGDRRSVWCLLWCVCAT